MGRGRGAGGHVIGRSEARGPIGHRAARTRQNLTSTPESGPVVALAAAVVRFPIPRAAGGSRTRATAPSCGAGCRSTFGGKSFNPRRTPGLWECNALHNNFGFSTPKKPTVCGASPVSLGSFSRQGAAPRGAVPSHGEPSARAGAAAREGQVVRLARFLSRIPFPDPPPTRPPRRSRHTRAARRHRADDLARRSRHPRAETDETRRASRP